MTRRCGSLNENVIKLVPWADQIVTLLHTVDHAKESLTFVSNIFLVNYETGYNTGGMGKGQSKEVSFEFWINYQYLK